VIGEYFWAFEVGLPICKVVRHFLFLTFRLHPRSVRCIPLLCILIISAYNPTYIFYQQKQGSSFQFWAVIESDNRTHNIASLIEITAGNSFHEDEPHGRGQWIKGGEHAKYLLCRKRISREFCELVHSLRRSS
jgi:hypothetical protein